MDMSIILLFCNITADFQNQQFPPGSDNRMFYHFLHWLLGQISVLMLLEAFIIFIHIHYIHVKYVSSSYLSPSDVRHDPQHSMSKSGTFIVFYCDNVNEI